MADDDGLPALREGGGDLVEDRGFHVLVAQVGGDVPGVAPQVGPEPADGAAPVVPVGAGDGELTIGRSHQPSAISYQPPGPKAAGRLRGAGRGVRDATRERR